MKELANLIEFRHIAENSVLSSILNNIEVILLYITGEDKPGITSNLTAILAHYNIAVLDIGQAFIHDNLNLGILFEVPPGSESSAVLKDLLSKSYELGVQARF
jgi:phosphoserine phosphatase